MSGLPVGFLLLCRGVDRVNVEYGSLFELQVEFLPGILGRDVTSDEAGLCCYFTGNPLNRVVVAVQAGACRLPGWESAGVEPDSGIAVNNKKACFMIDSP